MTKKCNLVVLPFTGYPEMQEPLYVVLFEEAEDTLVSMQELSQIQWPDDKRPED